MRENESYESYIERHVKDTEEVPVEEEGKKGRTRRARKPKVNPFLTWDQKLDVAGSELDELAKESEETKRNSGRLIDTLTAVLEETDVRIAELKKEAYEFKRDVVVGAENFRTGKTMAEKVIRYMEEKLRGKDAMIEKLRLKNATLKNQMKKVEVQLRHKEEMGDVLHYIDFHQLQIENKQYMAKIDERNQELLKLKMTTGSTVQVLNSLKKKLSALMTETDWLRQEMQQRTDLLAKLRTDNKSVGAAIGQQARTKAGLKDEVEDSADMPVIMDYVQQKADHYRLQKDVASWQRKVEIAEISAARNRTLRSTLGGGTTGPV